MLPGIQTTTFWQAVTSIQKTCENFTHWTVVGWNCINCTSLPVLIFQRNTFCLGLEDPEITYFESGENPHSKLVTCYNYIFYSLFALVLLKQLGLNCPSNLWTIVPLKASSNKIVLSRVPRRTYMPFGENFMDLISFVSFSIVNVWNGLSL